MWIFTILARSVKAGRRSPGGSFGSPSGMLRQKFVKRGTQHWSCSVPVLRVWMDSASTSSELLSETGSIADSDLRDVDLDLAAVTTPTQVSRHFSSVRGISRGASRSCH